MVDDGVPFLMPSLHSFRRSCRLGLTAWVAVAGWLTGCGTTSLARPPDAFRQMASCVMAMHPSLSSPRREDVLAVVEEETTALAEERTPMAASLHRFVGAFDDAHIRVGSSVPPMRVFPLWLRWVDDVVFVDASPFSADAWPVGTELVAIDGVPMAEWMNTFVQWSTVDALPSGGSPSPEVQKAQVARRFAALLHGLMGDAASFEVTLRWEGAARTERVDAIAPADLEALRSQRQSAATWGTAATPMPTFERLTGETVLLRLATFGVPEMEAYTQAVDVIFAELGGDERLILDLRGNEGGFRTLGIAVLRHLLDDPFVQWRRAQTRITSIPSECEGHVSFLFSSPEGLRQFPGEPEGEGRRFEGDPLASLMEPTGQPHRGELVVFIDDATNSAAVEMVAALLAHREGVRVVGTETQGGCDRHTGEIPILYAVEGTSLGVLMSLVEVTLVEVPGCIAGRGITPDEEVIFTQEDFLSGRDAFLRQAMP